MRDVLIFFRKTNLPQRALDDARPHQTRILALAVPVEVMIYGFVITQSASAIIATALC
jgi:hypothetical protein